MAKPKSNSLSRALALLESISKSDSPLRFSELRAITPRVPDSTLSRLLKSLEDSQYIVHVAKTGYLSGSKTNRWMADIRRAPRSFQDIADEAIQLLTTATQESAAVALLDEKEIRIIKSKIVEGAVSIIGEGSLLHFESDHAAALAILSQLSPSRRSKALKSRSSRIRGAAQYIAGVRTSFQENGIWLDRSRDRPGICRMALGFTRNDQPGAIFLCLTRESADMHGDSLRRALRDAQKVLLNQSSVISSSDEGHRLP